METEPSNNIVDDLVEDENKSLEPAEIQKSAEETLAPEETLVPEETPSYNYPVYQCENQGVLVCCSAKETGGGQGFFKGCKWSPDGTCLLTCTDDSTLKLYDLPGDLYKSHNLPFQGCGSTEISPALKIKEGELIYDYCWHPHMSSWHPETCL